MNDIPKKIASFSVNHDIIDKGIYISRIDGDIVTYDLRTRRPNMGDYMDNITMHSTEHMLATFMRSSSIANDVIYFGPMGCQTGFYLLVRSRKNAEVLSALKDSLLKTINSSEMFGAKREECGNYKNLDLAAAKRECESYLAILNSKENDFEYGGK